MKKLNASKALIGDLVAASRILAEHEVLDAYGHVSVRHPTDKGRFLISRSLSPEFVTQDDIMECDLTGKVFGADNRPAYLERFIHAGVYAARPDINAVVHGHARVLIPFTVTSLRMRPVFLTADEIGSDVPVWDIRSRFGDSTDLLIVDMDQANDLARALGADGRVVLMRGHGFIAGGRSASQLIRICKALIDNAHVQLEASRFGDLARCQFNDLAESRSFKLHVRIIDQRLADANELAC